MAVNFRELGALKFDDIKPPTPLPEGTYFGTIKSHEFGESQKNKTPYLRFSFTITGAGEDVDPADLEGIDLTTRRLSQDFWLTPDSRYRLKDFIGSLGIPIEGMAIDEVLPDTTNAAVQMYVVQQPNLQEPDAPPRNSIKSVKGQQ